MFASWSWLAETTSPSLANLIRNVLQHVSSSSSPEALSSSSSRRFVSPGTGLSQRVDIFDPSSPVYHSPVILPIRPAYLSATKTATTATSIAAAARSSNTPTMRSARDSEDVVGNLLDDLAAAGDDGNNWTTEVSRDLAATIMSPVGKSPDGVPAIKALPPLPSQTEGLRISTVASKEIEPVRPEFIERWSEASILVRSPSDQITAVEEFGQVHLSAVQTSGASVSAAATAASSSKGSPSKAKFDELLSEIDKLTIENGIPEEKDERELKRVETRRQEAKPIVDRLSTSRLPELPKASDVEMTDATSAPSETNQTPESQISRGRPGHPLSAKLPMRVPVKPKAPEDSQAGFPGLWYRLPASSRTPGQSPVDHTPKSLAKMPGRVTMARGSSPTERGRVGRDRRCVASPKSVRILARSSSSDTSSEPHSPGRSPSPKRSNTETPPSGLPKSSGHISQAASADRQLYYVRSNLPVNSNRVNDLFAGILRGEGKE